MSWSVVGGAALGMLLPAVLGFAALSAVTGPRVMSPAERLALAYPAGAALLTATVYFGLGWGRIEFTRASFAVAAIVPALLLGWIAVRRRKPASSPPRAAALAPPQRALVAVLGALLATKVAFVLFEIVRRPVTGWDSFSVWALRAKVWAARGGLVLDLRDPFFRGAGARPDYPPHVSLLQTWTAIWLGSWNDVLVNLPWACYYLSALLFLYATLVRRVSRPWALGAGFLLAGTPLFLAQAAVAGYGDMILSVHFAAAAVAVYLWASEGRAAHLLVALAFAASLPFIKLEGLPLAGACAGAIAMQAPPLRRRGLRWLLVAGVGLAALVVVSRNLQLRFLVLHSTFHRAALFPLLRSLVAMGNWHLLWVLFFAVAALRLRAMWNTPLGWLLATILAPMILFAATLLFTDAAAFTVQQTAAGRLFLQLAPAAIFFIVIAAAEACGAAATPRGPGAPA